MIFSITTLQVYSSILEKFGKWQKARIFRMFSELTPIFTAFKTSN